MESLPVTSKNKSSNGLVRVDDWVQLRNPRRRGVVKWIGNIEGRERYGILLDDTWIGEGKNNGTLNGIFYFAAPYRGGVFVTKSKIASVLHRSQKMSMIKQVEDLQEIVGGEVEIVQRQSHFLLHLVKELREEKTLLRTLRRISSHFSLQLMKDSKSQTPRHDSQRKGRLTNSGGPTTRSEFYLGSPAKLKCLPTGSSKSLSREFDELDANVRPSLLSHQPEPCSRGLSIQIDPPSKPSASDSPIPLSQNFDSVERSASRGASSGGSFLSPRGTRNAARTIWESDSLLDLMNQFEGVTEEEWVEEVQMEMDEDPVLWCLSKDARAQLNNPDAVVDCLHQLQRSINLIDKFIPEVTNVLQKSETQEVYMTTVIQELLKRAQDSEMSNRILKDFSSVDCQLEAQDLYAQDDIEKMVKLIAWVRNNIVASCVTDENDAKMACLGAKEIQESLKSMLRTQAKAREEKTDFAAIPTRPRFAGHGNASDEARQKAASM